MDRRQALKEGMRNLLGTVPLFLGGLAVLGGRLPTLNPAGTGKRSAASFPGKKSEQSKNSQQSHENVQETKEDNE